ncbi:MAG: peptidase M23, partial [Clostridia bacterium]|nr:peptidase M23 [Clostridia bacterium]
MTFRPTKRWITYGLLISLSVFTLSSVAESTGLNDKLKQVRQKQSQTQQRITEQKGEVRDITQKISALNATINDKRNEIADLNGRIAANKKQLAETEALLEQAAEKLEKSNETLNQRVRFYYENGQVAYLEVLLEARNFSDFINRMELMKMIMEQDKEIINRV